MKHPVAVVVMTMGLGEIMTLGTKSTEAYMWKKQKGTIGTIGGTRWNWWWESTKDWHMCNSLFKEKAHNPKIFSQTKHVTKKEDINLKRWGLQAQKLGMVEGTRERWQGMELRWQHGMGSS